jgi:hypothetical protein
MRTLLLLLLCLQLRADEAWVETLKKTPFPTNSIRLQHSEPVDLILKAFRSEGALRGVVLCPSASDDLYFFDWGTLKLDSAQPTLWDALAAITNKTKLQLTFEAPLLLIHAARDKIEDPLSFASKGEEIALLDRKLPGRTYYIDRPWDRIHSFLKKKSKMKVLPKATDPGTWHYYRISMAGDDLSVHDFIKALAYGAKTTVRIEKRIITFKSFT